MKHTTRKNPRKQVAPYPSKDSLWAYHMQAIEPKSDAINKAFPRHHPQWLQRTQMREATPEAFKIYREQMGLNQGQCAAYLRTSRRTIINWEQGDTAIPFFAVEVLRLMLESVRFKTSHKEWDGWFISDQGVLVSPHVGGSGFTPEQLCYYAHCGTEASHLRREVNQLKRELEAAQAENTELRQMFVSQGVVDELHTMHDRMNDLIKQIATAKVLQFGKEAATQPMERAA